MILLEKYFAGRYERYRDLKRKNKVKVMSKVSCGKRIFEAKGKVCIKLNRVEN